MIRGRKGRKRNAGFTLVELMIVVAIIGVLAAIAIPAFSRYVKKSRTAEASGHLNKMWSGSVSYYESDFMSGTTTLARQFPGLAAAPVMEEAAGRCCQVAGGNGKCPGNSTVYQTDPGWVALNFSIADAHNYVPQYTSTGTGTSAQFTARAWGDLDCDGVMAEFRRVGGINASGDVWSQAGMQVVNEIE